MIRELITGLRTLTILRVPGRDSMNLADSLFSFPFVGALIGGLVALVGWVIKEYVYWPIGAGALCLTVPVVLTGGLHLDGLADVFDSFGGKTRERKLEIMKDSRIGAFGVVAIVVCLLIKFASLVRIVEMREYFLLVVPFVLSRLVQVQLSAFLPYARKELGTGAPFIDKGEMRHFVVAAIVATVICFLLASWVGLVLLFAACLAGILLQRWMLRVFSGVTGDLLGMTNEIIETFLFTSIAVTLSISHYS